MLGRYPGLERPPDPGVSVELSPQDLRKVTLAHLQLSRETALAQTVGPHLFLHAREEFPGRHSLWYASKCIRMHHSTQSVVLKSGSNYRTWHLPGPEREVVPGVRWGSYEQLLTPAFWAVRARIQEASIKADGFRLGRTLREEVAACLLGGYGMGAEIALAAFHRLQSTDVLNGAPDALELEAMLSKPIEVAGRRMFYRFPRQKARFLSQALAMVDGLASLTDSPLRDALLGLPGIGPKTASWITRNWCDSDAVAILDVHICRACELAGVFAAGSDPAREYFSLESRFLAFASALGSRASVLDALMWQTMRRFPRRFRIVSAQ